MMPSINDELEALPKQREYTHDMQGVVVRLPRTNIIVVPFAMQSGGHWSCVVVDGSACTYENGRQSYPRGGYHIDVSPLELQTAIEMVVKERELPNFNLPIHRTEAGYPNCSTCDGGGCPDCTDPA